MGRTFMTPSEGTRALAMLWNSKGGQLTCRWREFNDLARTTDTGVHDADLTQVSEIYLEDVRLIDAVSRLVLHRVRRDTHDHLKYTNNL